MAEQEYDTAVGKKSFKAPVIRKGYYAGQLIKVKDFVDEAGNAKENKFGPQIILDFALFHIDQDTNTVTKPVQVTEENVKTDVVLSTFLNTKYHVTDPKTKANVMDPTGKALYRTAFTPGSRTGKFFLALGWGGPESGSKIAPTSYVGAWAEINVDDYVNKEGATISSIKDIAKLKNVKIPDGLSAIQKETPSEPNLKPIEELPEATQEKIRQLQKLKEQGFLSEGGYNDAVTQLRSL